MLKLRELLEAYRWLWRAERRWHPASRWTSGARFSVRVMADMLRTMFAPSSEGNVMSYAKPVVLAGAVVVVALTVAVQRDLVPDVPTGSSVWAYEPGGFTLTIPATWERSDPPAAELSPLDRQTVVAGSAHRRKVGGLLVPRFLSVRTLDLGVIPMGTRMFDVAELVTRARAPDEILGRPTPVAAGVLIATYRTMDRGEPISQAGIFLLGGGGHGFMIEVTSERQDEPILLEEAWRIADSVEHEHEPLLDLTISLAESFAVPFQELDVVWRTMPDSAGTRFLEAPLSFVADVADMSMCRAAAITFWARGLRGAALQGVPFSRRFEMRASCRTSTVTISYDLARGETALRQVDATGTVVLELRAPTALLMTTSMGQSTPYTILRAGG